MGVLKEWIANHFTCIMNWVILILVIVAFDFFIKK